MPRPHDGHAVLRPSLGLASALFAVHVAAKLVALPVAAPASVPAWLSALAGDAAVSVLFAAVTWRAPRVVAWIGYVLLVGLAALNATLVRALGTPLVVSMLRGVDEAMQDSAAHYMSLGHIGPALGVLAVGLVAPGRTRRWPRRAHHVLAAAAVGLAVLGAFLPAAVPAQRNGVVALLRSALPRAWAKDSGPPTDLRTPRPAAREPGLEHLPGSARGRSVVVVVLESAAARFVGAYGATPDAMPFVSDTARRSLLCTRAWAVYPESIKGQLALWHSTAPAPDVDVEQHARIPVPGLATLLAGTGYATGLFHAGRFRFLGMDAVLRHSGFAVQTDAATIGGDRESSFGVDEESTVAALLRWVDSVPPAQPFLAAYLPVAGHHPYASPPGGPFPRDNVRDCYRAALHYADRAVRTLWEGLCARRDPHTLALCVVGDHGQAFGEHDGNFGHTFAVYEENLHVPLLFCVPGVSDRGVVCARVASHLDVAPTLLDLLGQPACPDHQGASLLEPLARRAFAFTDWGDPLVAMRDGDWKLVLDLGSGSAALFDLGQDPSEQHDVNQQAPARTAAAAAAARAWIGRVRATVAGW
ncbi:MAG: sulfatase-like hydrolase/transferase [Planctomycetota bacterium]